MNELIPASLAGERIDRVVAVLTDLARSTVADMVARGDVRLDGAAVTVRSTKVREGQRLEVVVPGTEVDLPQGDAAVTFQVLHEDPHLLVVDKPAGLVVHPGSGNEDGTLVHGLLARFPDIAIERPGDPVRPGIVHRLDAGTSGLLVVARTQEAYDQLVAMMKAREVERRYLTLVWGHVHPERGVIDAPIGRAESDRTKMAVSALGREARTSYTVLRHHDAPATSLVGAQLQTGRTHQIRVHFTAIGHPVVGDRRYRGVRQGVEMERPFLHARSLRFMHPVTGEPMAFRSSLPADLQAVLRAFQMDVPADLDADIFDAEA